MGTQFSRPEGRGTTLKALKVGESPLFVGNGGPVQKIMAIIAGEFARNGLNSTNYSQKKALLIIDEQEAPIACTIVTRDR